MFISMLRTNRTFIAALAASTLSLVGCASTNLAAQWVDPQFKGRSLRDTKVFVVCEAADVSIKRICQDQVAAQMKTLGATPVKGPETDNSTPAPQPVADPYFPAARDAGAT